MVGGSNPSVGTDRAWSSRRIRAESRYLRSIRLGPRLLALGGHISTQLFINRPIVQKLVKWTGTNFTEVRAFVDAGVPITDHLDGTLETYPGSIAQVGDWFFSFGPFVDQAYMDFFQEVSGDPRFYVVSEDHLNLSTLERRSKTVNVPGLLLLQKSTITVVWDTPMPSAVYDVSIVPTGAATLVGNINWTLVSQTASGCAISVQAVLAIGVGTTQLKVSAIN